MYYEKVEGQMARVVGVRKVKVVEERSEVEANETIRSWMWCIPWVQGVILAS
jgi:hypothetical protein